MYYDGIWSIEIRGKARKALKRFPEKEAGVILDVIESFKTDPFGGDIEKLGGEANAWRRRVGSYRIFYEIYPRTHSVYVYWVERRGSHTYSG
jgi:mRNA-degrading endonuclease RelE of RelBE toxin-antitoxin system